MPIPAGLQWIDKSVQPSVPGAPSIRTLWRDWQPAMPEGGRELGKKSFMEGHKDVRPLEDWWVELCSAALHCAVLGCAWFSRVMVRGER